MSSWCPGARRAAAATTATARRRTTTRRGATTTAASPRSRDRDRPGPLRGPRAARPATATNVAARATETKATDVRAPASYQGRDVYPRQRRPDHPSGRVDGPRPSRECIA